MQQTVLFPYFESVACAYPFSQIKAAYGRLQKKYLDKEGTLKGQAEHAAYVLTRMGGTFFACCRAMEHVRQCLLTFAPNRMLDLGAGPGGASLAACLLFPSIQMVTAFEKDEEFYPFFQKFIGQDFFLEKTVRLEPGDMGFSLQAKKDMYDFVIASYSLGETDEMYRSMVLENIRDRAAVLLVVEPGTPDGFSTILDVRKKAIALGGKIVAPCPHNRHCDMENSSRWCHESVRIFRTATQRRLKDASLGYEDEKFCYMCVSFSPSLVIHTPQLRLVHVPQHRHGHLFCIACTESGQIEKVVFSKKHKDVYRHAKQACWGDGLNRVEDFSK